MARQRKLSPERKAFINSLIEHYQPEDAQDVQEMLKDLFRRFFTRNAWKKCIRHVSHQGMRSSVFLWADWR